MLKLLLPPLQAVCSLNIAAFFFFSPFSKKSNYAGASMHHCRHFNDLAFSKARFPNKQ